eukprot:TRINITY_DN9070_c0_g1_i1.p1 TRINITY_DN9070_c0_g1~~TRINITY_DN9070_c0_g1_i1.p1  ORF type:complete len:776 (-),score=136.85 TRINITY_DN9070_c0_g1_i1:516-2798(-)
MDSAPLRWNRLGRACRLALLLMSSSELASAEDRLKPLAATAAPSAECIASINDLKSQKERAATYALATGKMVPNDAGKYSVCVNAPDSRYFLVDFKLQPVNKDAAALECKLGLCMPDACVDQDIPPLLAEGYSVAIWHWPNLTHVGQLDVDSISAASELAVQPPDVYGVIAMIVFTLLVVKVLSATWLTWRHEKRRAAACEEAASLGDRRATVSEASTATGGTGGAARQASSPTPPPPMRDNSWSTAMRQPMIASSPTATSQCAPTPSLGAAMSQSDAKPLPLLVQAFSLVGKNGTLTKLFETQPYRPTDCLNGVRVISMFWIILGHTFLMPEGIMGYINQEDVVVNPLNPNAAESNPLLMLIIAAEQGVDTFFFLAGFLLSYAQLPEMKKSGGKCGAGMVGMAVVLRYVRLTPSLAFAMLIYYKILAFAATGPFAYAYQHSITRRCDGSWWSELTYTMNFIPFDSDNVCMGWTWYLGDDMIFFIVGVLLLPIFYRSRILGWSVATLLLAASSVITIFLVVKYGLTIYVFNDDYKVYSYYAYSKPYCRIGAYLVGIMTSWLLYTMENSGLTRDRMASFPGTVNSLRACCTAGCGFLLFMVFIPHTDFGYDKDSWPTWANVMYINFGRMAWSASCGALTLACYYGATPWMDGFLSHWAWTPLVRLTYGAYLMHPVVIKLMAGNARQFYTFSAEDLTYRLIGNCILAYAASAVLWCMMERPVMTVVSASLKKKKGQPAQRSTQEGGVQAQESLKKPAAACSP